MEGIVTILRQMSKCQQRKFSSNNCLKIFFCHKPATLWLNRNNRTIAPFIWNRNKMSLNLKLKIAPLSPPPSAPKNPKPNPTISPKATPTPISKLLKIRCWRQKNILSRLMGRYLVGRGRDWRRRIARRGCC